MASSTATDVAADAAADAAANALLSRIRETLVGADDTLVAILRRLKATILAPTPSGGLVSLGVPFSAVYAAISCGVNSASFLT